MSGKTHMTGGLLLGSTVLYVSKTFAITPEPITSGLYLASCILGSLLCDIDEKNSIIGRRLWMFSFLFSLIHSVFRILACFFPKGSNIRKNIANISRMAAHRGMMHWPVTFLCFGIFTFILTDAMLPMILKDSTIILYAYTLSLGISTGMLSHLAYDFVSGKLALLAPFHNKRYGISLVKSNGFIDNYIIRTTSLLGGAYLLFLSFQ